MFANWFRFEAKGIGDRMVALLICSWMRRTASTFGLLQIYWPNAVHDAQLKGIGERKEFRLEANVVPVAAKSNGVVASPNNPVATTT